MKRTLNPCRIAEQKEKEQEQVVAGDDVAVENAGEASTMSNEESAGEEKNEETADENLAIDLTEGIDASLTEDSSNELKKAATTASEEVPEVSAVDMESTAEDHSASTDAIKEKEIKQEAIGVVSTNAVVAEDESPKVVVETANGDEAAKDADHSTQLAVAKTTKAPSAEEKFLVLLDSLIADVSSKTERANLIANSTGATLVHLEKTQLVQLVEYGKREILAATRPESDQDEESETEHNRDDTASSNNSEVDDLIKIFDLRHQILSSQAQFERTTSTLAKRTEKHLRNAETELMELEESRTVEASAIMKVVDLINHYSSDLDKCGQKIHFNEMLLESINHRRNYIRSTNINERFVPSYRYSTKLMTTSSDQLLLTVLLDKLRDITESVNEWTKMERHFEKMTSSFNKSLTLIGTKRKRTGAPVALPPTPALFAKVKIPPSRRLIERQIANYEMNLNAIRQNRARMRKTLSGILKIAREEHLSEEIVNMTDMLYQKCRDLKAEEEEEQQKLKEEAEAEADAKAPEEAEHTVHDIQSTDGGEASADEPEAKKQRLQKAESASDSSLDVNTIANATPVSKVAPPSDVKGISSLLGSEDSDAKESSYSSAESKSRVDNDDDSEGDLEQASRAIADITSSVLPDLPGGTDSRMDLLNSPPLNGKPSTEPSRTFGSQSQFMIRGNDKHNTSAQQSDQGEFEQQSSQGNTHNAHNQQSFFDQALEVLNKQQEQQQRLEQERLENQQQIANEKRQQELEHQRQMEQQRHQEQELQEREKQQRMIERQRLEKQRMEQMRREQELREHERREQQLRERERREQERRELERREQERREQERREQERREQQRVEEQRRRMEEEQRRLEQQQRIEQQQRLEQQQRMEQEKQRQEQLRQEQQRKEKLQQEQHRMEMQRRHQEQQQRQFQRGKTPNLPQVVPPGSSHMQMLSQQQQQQLQQQQAALQQQQHSRQMQHPLYGDMPKGMLMSSGMGSSQQDIYAQQAAQMGMDMHDVVRHQDSSHYVGGAPGGLRGAPYMPPNEVPRNVAPQPAPTAPRTSFYGDDGQAGQMHSQDVFGSQGLPGQQRQLPDHHMFANELQQQQQPGQPQSRGMVSQDFLMGRSYRGLNGNNMQHPGMDQTDNNDVNMGDWGQ
ncbi:unnamed protein product [Phytophthora lilii]|uniref:Unnamed protein product n=1 Tax=Phytophthora lilii TaxID=2077276 RepID=A0A9W6UCQ3_9STRA|nr:unnamed protein product [Phytophthora lilii]